MTHLQALEIIHQRFPGFRAYVSCYVWLGEDGKLNAPRFSVCIYDVKKDRNASEAGNTVKEALDKAMLTAQNIQEEKHPGEIQAEEMFAAF